MTYMVRGRAQRMATASLRNWAMSGETSVPGIWGILEAAAGAMMLEKCNG